jgi:polysaccharide export outer membrane protein
MAIERLPRQPESLFVSSIEPSPTLVLRSCRTTKCGSVPLFLFSNPPHLPGMLTVPQTQLQKAVSAATRAAVAVLGLSMSACTFLPSAGPSDYRIRKEAGRVSADGASYQLLVVDSPTIEALKEHSPRPSYLSVTGRDVMKFFRNRGIDKLGQGSAQAIQPGDVVHVAIFESGGGLFQPMAADSRAGGTPVTSLPAQPIDQRGEITVPYAGRVKAIGRLPGDLETEIAALLKDKTVDPQVIVTVMQREGGNLVSVGGDVKAARQVPVSLAGTRVIDAITAAGGPTSSRPHEVMVSVTRNGQTRADTLQNLYDDPGKNILLQPTDTVILRNISLSYMVFGASGTVGSVPIDVEDLSLAQAMARTGGANDMRANPAAVFVYRGEDRGVLEAAGQTGGLPPGSGPVPVIYQLKLQDPEGFFYASNFKVRDQDIVYYANAQSLGVGKFMSLLNTLFSPVGVAAQGGAVVRIYNPATFP